MAHVSVVLTLTKQTELLLRGKKRPLGGKSNAWPLPPWSSGRR
jgi:hypothetical protein